MFDFACYATLFFVLGRYDFGITAWTVLMIKGRGAEDASSVYVYLANHGEALGILVACSAIGGTIGGIIGRQVRFAIFLPQT